MQVDTLFVGAESRYKAEGMWLFDSVVIISVVMAVRGDISLQIPRGMSHRT